MSGNQRDAIILVVIAIVVGFSYLVHSNQDATRAEAIKNGDPVTWLRSKPLDGCGTNFIDASIDGNKLTIVEKASGLLGASKDIRIMSSYATECYAGGIFKNFPKVERLETRFNADLVDMRGHTSNDTIVRFDISRKNTEDVNWENVLPENVSRLADHYWEAPAVARADEK
jgi:hypothetical protein